MRVARRGAHVLGVEARPGNVARARFAKKDALGLANWSSSERRAQPLARENGSFRVVSAWASCITCRPDVFEFAARVAAVTERVANFDTPRAFARGEADRCSGRRPRTRPRSRLRGTRYQEFDVLVGRGP